MANVRMKCAADSTEIDRVDVVERILCFAGEDTTDSEDLRVNARHVVSVCE